MAYHRYGLAGADQIQEMDVKRYNILLEDSLERLGIAPVSSSTTANKRNERSDIMWDEIVGVMAKWQAETMSRIPTIVAASTFISVHSVTCAYPSRALLYPILP